MPNEQGGWTCSFCRRTWAATKTKCAGCGELRAPGATALVSGPTATSLTGELMSAAPPLVWDHLESKDPGLTSRLKVPGGWLVRVVFQVGVAITFFPDPDHSWTAASSDKFREVS